VIRLRYAIVTGMNVEGEWAKSLQPLILLLIFYSLMNKI
jgi:hypothetical protein